MTRDALLESKSEKRRRDLTRMIRPDALDSREVVGVQLYGWNQLSGQIYFVQ